MTSRSDFGSVDPLPSGRWRARVRIGGTRRSLGTYPTDKEAWDAIEAALGRLQAGHVDAGGADSLRVHGAAVLDARELDGVRDVDGERRRWRRHIATWELADAPVRAIRKGDVYDWMAAVARATSRPTAQRCLSLLRAVLDDAVRRGMIESNPARGISLPGRPGRVDDPWTYLSPDEQRAVLTSETIPEPDRILIAMALGTGIREGEQASIHLQDVFVGVDESSPRMVVRRSGKGATKSGRPRTIHLFGLGLAAVRAWIERLPSYATKNPRGLLCPMPSGAQRGKGHPLGTVWVVEEGKRRRRCRWGLLQEQAGVRRVRWHDLRHTFATSCVAGWFGLEWSLEQLCEYLGHSSIVVTQRYAHLRAAAARTAAVTHFAGHAGERVDVGSAANPLILPVGQPGLEPGTDGLKGLRAPVSRRELAPDRGPVVTLLVEYLQAVAAGDPRRDAIGVRAAEAALPLLLADLRRVSA